MNKCLNCNKETKNPKFCSKNCAASYNNKFYPKRKVKKYYCTVCNKTEVKYRRKFCSDCIKKIKEEKNELLLKDAIYTKHHRAAAFSLVRYRAKKLTNELKEYQRCMNCGYDKHVEICHIKPISNFMDNDYVTDINSLDNLLSLCPNCHWEFDFGELTLEQIKNKWG